MTLRNRKSIAGRSHDAMMAYRTTNHNNRFALGLDQRAIDFFLMNVKHIRRGLPKYFSSIQTKLAHSSNSHDRDSMSSIATKFIAARLKIRMICPAYISTDAIPITLRHVFQVNRVPRAIDINDNNAGLKNVGLA